ncbi:FAD-binding protein [Kibdelosporangium philippinense]|uniref:FAD-binding protein n=1 Tax=Kibdelosporangium philippinense TaxID=211113 RepID=A0ABS8ZVV7_9PSEU|nr:FAD-linked oxidase C-terminal domain-containing protein [Kibdelosporangium philippinense]MCE7011870.1 FAD-binding protein [Kibdelosporangium philippinense]
MTSLPASATIDDPDVLAAYSTDRATFCPSGTPRALVRARSLDDVVQTLKWAYANNVPVVPQGARTGQSGGANALDGCVLLNLEKLDQILEIDVEEQIAVVQPGVINATLAAAVAEKGLYYPPDPGSKDISSLGGNVATNAGGMCCLKYGVTGDFVRALQVVLADGRVMRTGRRTAKGVAGYDLTHLFVGSEGTLGVVTEVTVALRPAVARPLAAVAFFDTTADACRAVADHLGAGFRPAALEFMDAATIEAVSKLRDLGFPPGTGAVLIAQSDAGTKAPEELAAFELSARKCAATEVVVSDDPAEADLLMQGRRLVGLSFEEYPASLVDDVCVPRRNLAALVDGIERIASENGVMIATCGHAGDGNMHPAVLFDHSQAEAAQKAFDEVMRLGLELGGTITGEHGVGLLKRDWLARELDEAALWSHHQIKQALDPRGIMNPGRVINSTGTGRGEVDQRSF